VDLAWQHGQLTAVTIRSLAGRPAKFWFGDKWVGLDLRKGEAVRLDGALRGQVPVGVL
jgi:hypothetical protein